MTSSKKIIREYRSRNALWSPLLSLFLSCSVALPYAAWAQSPDGTASNNGFPQLTELLRAAQSAALQNGQAPRGNASPADHEPEDAASTNGSPGFRTVPVLGAQTPPAATTGLINPGAAQPLVLKELPSALSLYVGQMTLIEVRDVVRVAVGNGKVMEARVVDQKNLLITALEAGESTVHLWNKNGRINSLKIRVNVVDLGRIYDEISRLTAGISGVSISRVGEKIILDGSNLDPAAVSRLKSIASLYGPSVVSFATSERLRVDRMIEVQVRIVEFSKTALDDLGMKWDASGDGFNFGLFSDIASNSNYRILPEGSPFLDLRGNNGNGNGIGTGDGLLDRRRNRARYYFGLSTALHSTINLLVRRGNAFLLASPTLTTRSGGDAKFLSGGEIPLPAMSALGTGSVTYKPYGLRLDIKPVADGAGIISGSILAEVSGIDRSIAVQGIPGLQTRRTETEFNVNEGDTIVISGLLSRESTRATDGLPGLRNIPVLGWAFKNANDSDKLMETVVFLTPRVVTARDSLARIERTNVLEQDISGGFGNLTEDRSKTSKPAESPAPRPGASELDPATFSPN